MSSGITVIDISSDVTVCQALDRFSDQQHLLLLNSAGRIRERDSRYSFLTADPILIRTVLTAEFQCEPFAQLREWQQMLPELESGTVPPFCGGIAGLLSYELGTAFERIPSGESDAFRTPSMIAGLFDWCIVWDHIASTVRAFVLELKLPVEGQSADSRHKSRIQWIRNRLSERTGCFRTPQRICAGQQVNLAAEATGHRLPLDSKAEVWTNFSRSEYIAAVNRVLEYIRAGDIFQANLSQQLTARWSGTAEELFLRVRQLNPAPFCALLRTRDFAVVSASPERFLKVTRARFVETRPIKGTRRRQKSPIADLYTTAELTHSPKDRAENVMIVDLLRNDLSRSCRPGTVRVIGLCEVELFETVQHLVSTVVGELRPEMDVWDLVAGCFPGGSITGAPKIRAMQIISELEQATRGAYCGSLFYAGPGQDFDSSILIRTFTLLNGMVRFPVGGGIVADSVADDEYRETLHKASGMLRALLPAEE